MTESASKRSCAFTMIELLVVLVILATLASLAVLSLGGTVDQYQLGRAVEIIERFDARARRDARTLQTPLRASIDRSRGRLTIGESPISQRASYRLPKSVRIKQLRMRRQISAGSQFDFDVNRDGHSPTYALLLERGNVNRWLVVLGFSGQVIRLDSKGEVDALLAI
jgi:prepilin-type N-terminal cleavage/methylation domain-containing protein